MSNIMSLRYAMTTATLALDVITSGACVGSTDPDAWFPPEPAQGGNVSAEAVAMRRADYENTARSLCGGCSVQAECLELALREESNLPRTWIHGIRGGTAPWQRENLIRYRKRLAARVVEVFETEVA
jgi:hypothetical protein